jgi:predicted TIM-barrel fold metal-dependent hydrolase
MPGISRAVILSVAYSFSNPNKPPVSKEYADVMAENDWTSAQVAKYPHRLIGFTALIHSGHMPSMKSHVVPETQICAPD